MMENIYEVVFGPVVTVGVSKGRVVSTTIEWADSFQGAWQDGIEQPYDDPATQALCDLVDNGAVRLTAVNGETRDQVLTLLGQYKQWERECEAAEYTDTGTAWVYLSELAGHLYDLVGASHADVTPEALEQRS